MVDTIFIENINHPSKRWAPSCWKRFPRITADSRRDLIRGITVAKPARGVSTQSTLHTTGGARTPRQPVKPIFQQPL